MDVGGRIAWNICAAWNITVRSPSSGLSEVNPFVSRYLQNGNILAARTFITHFTSSAGKTLGLASGHPSVAVGPDEVVLTKDPILNFAQMAVLTCQRANGDTNRVVRESWIRLCGTYQSRAGVLALPEVRKVRQHPFLVPRLSKIGPGSARYRDAVLCFTSAARPACESVW